ncbi:electron transport complex subunit RsxG [Pseudazoarcus pumilus]|uniref:Ion-translocating oxidoreductase complex subunit G n=1 Tax=Pseudazoarcus pumilus TaxID=2067960 RepID=A0A2I6S6R2_9RHOO|nr:electron transport complex subunit RsxG [Pseudazoarcus pumilus]AUN94945.1 electron transport complex subunit RsxG [Pseudazoarcus pumilus]
MSDERYTASRTALRTAGIMLVFTLVFTALMAATYRLTAPSIAEAVQTHKMRLIHDILPPGSYDNDLLADVVELGPAPELGLVRGGQVYRARQGGAPAALVLDVVAPDGYAGRVALAVAVGIEGRVSGVRVTEHAETPGLGDYIDPAKDRNRESPWIDQFEGASFAGTPPSDWRVTKDGGAFDYHVGATISARAVIEATRRALHWATTHREALFDAPAGARLQLE